MSSTLTLSNLVLKQAKDLQFQNGIKDQHALKMVRKTCFFFIHDQPLKVKYIRNVSTVQLLPIPKPLGQTPTPQNFYENDLSGGFYETCFNKHNTLPQ